MFLSDSFYKRIVESGLLNGIHKKKLSDPETLQHSSSTEEALLPDADAGASATRSKAKRSKTGPRSTRRRTRTVKSEQPNATHSTDTPNLLGSHLHLEVLDVVDLQAKHAPSRPPAGIYSQDGRLCVRLCRKRPALC